MKKAPWLIVGTIFAGIWAVIKIASAPLTGFVKHSDKGYDNLEKFMWLREMMKKR